MSVLLMICLVCVVLCLLFVIYTKLIEPELYWRSRDVFHVSPWSRLVKVFLSGASFVETIRQAYDDFPNLRYYGSYQFLRPSLFVRDIDLIKQITVKDFDHFTDHMVFGNEKNDPIGAANLLFLKGQRWRDMRSTLSPAFTSSKMKSMFILISEIAENFVDHYRNIDKEIIVLDLKDAYAKYTNDVIASCAFGIKCDSLRDEENEFFRMGKEALGFNLGRAIKGLLVMFFPKIFEMLKVSVFPQFVSKFFLRVVQDTIAEREKNGIIRPDMIHLLMEARKGRLVDKTISKNELSSYAATEEYVKNESNVTLKLSDNEITAQALIFFLAGFETASTVTSFLSFEIALQPEIQHKLQQEIDEVGEQATYENILKLKYLDQVVSETLRKWAPAFALNRICVKDYTIMPKNENEKPLLIEKDCLITIPVCGLHHDEKYFPNPDRFDPERFSEENRGSIVPGSYFPFGIGPRNCIGSRFALLEMKVLIFHILSNFEIVPVEKTRVPIRLAKTLNLTAKDGFWLGLKKRNKLNYSK